MNNLSLIESKTMTLKEVTDLLECRHNDAMLTVAKMAESPEFGDVTKSPYRTKMGNYYDTYQLNQRQSIAVAAKLNTPMLMRVIDRWQELESKQSTSSLPNFSNPVEAARAWANEVEQKQSAFALIEVKDAQIHAKDQFIIASNEASIKAGEVLVREFCKSNDIIDLGQNEFYEWMRSQGYILKNSTEPAGKYEKLGYFKWRPSLEKFGGKIRYQTYITPRGKVWLAAKYMAYLDKDMAA